VEALKSLDRKTLRMLTELADEAGVLSLFAPLGRDEVYTVTLRVPLVDRMAVAPVAVDRPLLAAWTDGAPAGIVATL